MNNWRYIRGATLLVMATGSVFIEQVNVRAFIAGSGALMRIEIPQDKTKKLYIIVRSA